jgi:organic radical activating enzyme
MRLTRTLAAAVALQRLASISLSGEKSPFGCSMAATGRCNLKCIHCYEMGRRDEKTGELDIDGISALSERLFSNGMRHCTITDGEPFLDRASVEKCESIVETFWATYIVTNGTREFPDMPATYIVSLDGPKNIHDRIRGDGVFHNIEKNMKRAPHDDVFALCTLNTMNRSYIKEVVDAARGFGLKGMMFNWHNPLKDEDPLWVPWTQRNQDIDIILGMRENSGGFILNTRWELDLLRDPAWAKTCPAHWIQSYDAAGRRKRPCIFRDPGMCARCGCHVFPALKEVVRGRPSIEAALMFDHVRKWWLRDGVLAGLEIPESIGRDFAESKYNHRVIHCFRARVHTGQPDSRLERLPRMGTCGGVHNGNPLYIHDHHP